MKNSTKKTAAILCGLAVLVLVLVGAFAAGKHNANKNAKPSSAKSMVKVDTSRGEACDILTDAIAKQVLGGTAVKTPPLPAVNPNGFKASFCVYSGNNKTVSLYIRTPLTQTSKDALEKQFGSGRPKNSQAVKEFGYAGYWDTQYHQLNIKNNDRLFVISVGSTSNYAGRTLDDAKQLANLLFPDSNI